MLPDLFNSCHMKKKHLILDFMITSNSFLSFSNPQATAGGVRRFTKPPESLERSLELSRHRGRKRTQKRPNYKNLGEEEDDERAGGGSGSGGGLEEGWDDDGRGGERDGARDREKGKGTEGGGGGSSKGSRASGETAEGECVSHWTQQYRTVFVFSYSHQSNTVMYPGYPTTPQQQQPSSPNRKERHPLI